MSRQPNILQDQAGSVLPLFALSIPIALAGIGVALDYSSLTRRRADLQVAADTAALHATKVLAQSTAGSAAEKEQEARKAAERLLALQTPKAAKTITPLASDRSVTIDLSESKDLRFASWLGGSSKTIGADAKATYSDKPAGCVIAVGQGEEPGIELVGSAKITAPKCGVWSDSTGPNSITTQGAASITARNVCGVGGTSKAHSSPPAQSGCAAAPDPYKTRKLRCGKNQSTSCPTYKLSATGSGSGSNSGKGKKTQQSGSTYIGTCDYTNMSVPASAKGVVTLSPGVYCGGLSVQSADVVLLPGFYQMQDGPLALQGNASLTGAGVSILLSGMNAVLDLQGSPRMTLSAMTTGPLAGIAISSNTPDVPMLTSTLQGSPDVTLTGSIWLPNQVLKMQGSPSLTLNGATDKAIAYSFSLTGSPDLIVKADDSKESIGYSMLRLVR